MSTFLKDLYNAIRSITMSGGLTRVWTSTRGLFVSAAGVLDLGRIDVREYGAVGNGTTDDAAAITDAEAAATAAGTVAYYPPGTYLVESAVTVRGVMAPGATITTSGAGAVTFAGRGGAMNFSHSTRGNLTELPGTGSGNVALRLDGVLTALALDGGIVAAGQTVTIGMRVRVADEDGTDVYTDEFEFHISIDSGGDVRVTDGAGSTSGAFAYPASLAAITGPDSGYTYALTVYTTNLYFYLADHATQARDVRSVTCWWDIAEEDG